MTKQDEVVKDRRNFLYTATGAMGAVAVAAAVWPLIHQMNPSEDILAAPPFIIDLNTIPEGQTVKFSWFGELIIVRHRTADEIARARARADDKASMRHPEKDGDRVHRPEWLVMRGVCAYYGYTLLDQMGAFDGWFCVGCASHYDISGRVRKGIVGRNVPAIDHVFLDDTTIRIETNTRGYGSNRSPSVKYMNNG